MEIGNSIFCGFRRCFVIAVLSAAAFCVISHEAVAEKPLGLGKWSPSAGCRKAKTVTVDGLKAVQFTCNFRGTDIARGSWDSDVDIDFTTSNALQFQLYCENRSSISHFMIYFRSGGGWYVAPFDVERLGAWNKVTVRKSEMKWEGSPAGWSKVDTIRISAWRGDDRDAEFFVSDFQLVGSDAPIALVRGARKGGSPEAAAIANYAGTVAGQLDILGVPYVLLDETDVSASSLSSRKLVILPYNPKPSSQLIAEMQKYMRNGGKLICFYILPKALEGITGIKDDGHVDPAYSGYFSSIRPLDETRLSIPSVTGQSSWNIRRMSPVGNNAYVAAQWFDAKGVGTGEPAVLVSDNCVAMTHVYVDDDISNKRSLLLGMVGWFCPEIYGSAAQLSIDQIGVFGPYAKSDTAFRALKAVEGRKKGAGQYVRAAEGLRAKAQAHIDQKNFNKAMAAAADAREALIKSYCAVQEDEKGEKRLVWCHRANGVDGMSWDQSVKILADNGFTAVLPNMAWGGIAFYNSAVLPVSPGGDKLEECLEACKKYGVECHVWKVNWKMGSYAPGSFVAKMKRTGRTQVSFGGKEQDKWLCPSHPDNRRLEVESMLELVRKYDVDGIHFDYIRYPGNDNCFCNGCRRRFEASIGKKVSSWPSQARDGSLRKQWNDFRRENITAVVREVSEKARKFRPGVKISAAVFKNWPTDRNTIAQDWKVWCDRGYLDFVCPMDYTPSTATFEQNVISQKEWSGDVPCYPGIGLSTWSRSGDICKLIDQVMVTRKHNMGGFTIFEYGTSEANDVIPLCGLGLTRSR